MTAKRLSYDVPQRPAELEGRGSRREGFRLRSTTMSTLRVLALLTIASGFGPAVLLAETQPGELATASFTESVPLPDADAAGSCPYHFDSDMPAGTFCVYLGVARGGSGEECATDIVVLWSSWDGYAPVRGGPERTSSSTREIYLGFVAEPELVIRAIVDPRQNDRAEIVEYTLGSNEASQTLAGQMTLPAVRSGSADRLSMDFREPRRFRSGSCAFASYSGRFLGVIGLPSETTTSADTFLPPRE